MTMFVRLLLVLHVFLYGRTEALQRHLRSFMTPEERLETLNTSQYLVQFCNHYCDGHEKRKFDNLDFQTIPECLACECDVACRIYGDCCPDVTGDVIREPDPPTCLFSGNDLDIQSAPEFGVFMVTKCKRNSVHGDDEFHFQPVSSASRNMTFINPETADCNNVTDYVPWVLEIDCPSGDSSGDTSVLDLPDHLYDNEDGCAHVYSTSGQANPRMCSRMLALTQHISDCNVTGIWKEYDEEIETACYTHEYPVEDGGFLYQNIFCAMCNGVAPMRIPLSSIKIQKIPPSITVITQFFKSFKDPTMDEITCRDSEWMNPLQEKCMTLHCVPGKRLQDGDCVWNDDDIVGNQYMFNVLLKPENDNARASLGRWNTLQHMFVKNFESFMTLFHTTNYMFSIGLIEDMATIRSGSYDFQKGVVVNCSFIVTNNMNRTYLETNVVNFTTENWVVEVADSEFVFTPMLTNINLSKIELKAYYWADPVSGECCLPVADVFLLKDDSGDFPSRVIPVTNELHCPHVKLTSTEYETEDSDWIILKDINVSLPSSDYSIDHRQRAWICVDILTDVYNSSYRKRNTILDIPPSVYAQQILSLVCVTLSLVCLALTLITYAVFPVLRSLPTINNMCLMACLFTAQLLFQVGIDKTENEIVCRTIGVLIHYSWLCVIFWMNVCSFHMLRVFGVHSLMPHTKSKQTKTILGYCGYAFGLPAVIVAITITSSSVMSEGSEIGYGGVVCYLSSNNLVGFAFALPLSIVIAMNLTFFIVTVRAISKIENIKKHGMKDRQNVYVYIKLSSLTGMFWILAILAEVLHQDVLVYMSIILNGSLGVLLFLCYTTNKRVCDLWKGTCDQLRKRSLDDSRNITVSTSVKS